MFIVNNNTLWNNFIAKQFKKIISEAIFLYKLKHYCFKTHKLLTIYYVMCVKYIGIRYTTQLFILIFISEQQ